MKADHMLFQNSLSDGQVPSWRLAVCWQLCPVISRWFLEKIVWHSHWRHDTVGRLCRQSFSLFHCLTISVTSRVKSRHGAALLMPCRRESPYLSSSSPSLYPASRSAFECIIQNIYKYLTLVLWFSHQQVQLPSYLIFSEYMLITEF